jgi:DNA-binding beta-propeller fold protein YncE
MEKRELLEGIMKRSVAICLSVIVLCALKAHSQVDEPLKLVQTIPLPGLKDGDFDHFVVDLRGQRLFLAAEENAAVEVIDLRTNKVIHTLTEPKTPHSMAYNPESNKLFVVDEGPPNRVDIYDGTSYKLLGTIPMDAHADASIYDPASKLFYVGNGGKLAHEDYCMLSIVDTTSGQKVGDIKLDADHIEAMALEKSGSRLFVNLTSKNAVAVIDREKRTVIATWSNAEEGRANGPMAFDEANHRLFVVSRDPDKVIVLDSDSGKIVTSVPCVGQFISDDAVYDPASKRLYVVGTPFLDVFQQRSPNSYQLLGQVPNAFHANTAILVPQLNRYYVAVNHHGETDAVVQVYAIIP